MKEATPALLSLLLVACSLRPAASSADLNSEASPTLTAPFPLPTDDQAPTNGASIAGGGLNGETLEASSPAPLTALPGSVGSRAPLSLVTSAPSGAWLVVCEAPNDTNGDGALQVRLTQHGEFEGDQLRPMLYVGSAAHTIDEYAGANPQGRFLAYVVNGELRLLDTTNQKHVTLPNADVRATRASFQALRSVSFSDDGNHLVYLKGTASPSVVVRDLARQTERSFGLRVGSPYRVRFAPGGRYVLIEVPLRDTNKNGRLEWLHPERQGPAPCPSPIPTYDVWSFPGDTPDVLVLDVQTGKLTEPEGFVLAAGDAVVRRAEDKSLLAEYPGKPNLVISSKECNGRVMHVDVRTGVIVFGCANAWGQRRETFLRAAATRVQLGFNLAAYELDTLLPTNQPIIPFYPGNQTWLFNVRTRERWPLLDGTHVLAVSGTTALIEQNFELRVIQINPDGSNTPRSTAVPRAPFSEILRQGGFVAVGRHLFDLHTQSYAGIFELERTPLALSHAGQGLFAARDASPTELGSGPLSWHSASLADERAAPRATATRNR